MGLQARPRIYQRGNALIIKNKFAQLDAVGTVNSRKLPAGGLLSDCISAKTDTRVHEIREKRADFENCKF